MILIFDNVINPILLPQNVWYYAVKKQEKCCWRNYFSRLRYWVCKWFRQKKKRKFQDKTFWLFPIRNALNSCKLTINGRPRARERRRREVLKNYYVIFSVHKGKPTWIQYHGLNWFVSITQESELEELKPQANVGIFGALGHGSTTLMRAIFKTGKWPIKRMAWTRGSFNMKHYYINKIWWPVAAARGGGHSLKLCYGYVRPHWPHFQTACLWITPFYFSHFALT